MAPLADRSVLSVRDLARQVFGDDMYGSMFDTRMAAVIRHAGGEDRPLDALDADELADVTAVLERIGDGRLATHLRVDGTFELRMVPANRRRRG